MIICKITSIIRITPLFFEETRLVEPLKNLGYTHVVAELDAHSKTLGTDEIVFSDFGGMIRSAIGWLDE